MFFSSKQTTCFLLIFIGCVCGGCFGLTERLQTESADQPEFVSRSWEITLTRIKVVDAQEDRSFLGIPFSDGDEPYFVMFGVRSIVGTSGSTQILINKYEDSGWAGHLREGQQKSIPLSMGSLRFDNVRKDEVIGLVILSLEADRTPWAILRERIGEVQRSLANDVANLVEVRSAVDLSTNAFVDNMHNTLLQAVEPIATPLNTGQAIENLIFSGVDTDEVIAKNSMVFMLEPPTEAVRLPYYQPPYFTDVLNLKKKDYLFNQKALVFENSSLGVRYDVEVRVRAY